ncbi:hypothetical protein KAR28_05955 [Candidatus Parcubacteria bacterium]|nr:hypothetical protein [Candidatus Parcubacteria bacterium]
MANIKELTAVRLNTRAIARFLALAGTATILPFFIHLQWLTGPIVNAILIITLFLIGIRSALVLCLVPSMMALAGGLLPAILAPVIPFIMIGNVILVLAIDWFYINIKDNRKGFAIGIVVGAALKFIFLFFSVSVISDLLIKQELAVKVAQMMSWPQFATAITGGMLAWVALKWLKRI